MADKTEQNPTGYDPHAPLGEKIAKHPLNQPVADKPAAEPISPPPGAAHPAPGPQSADGPSLTSIVHDVARPDQPAVRPVRQQPDDPHNANTPPTQRPQPRE